MTHHLGLTDDGYSLRQFRERVAELEERVHLAEGVAELAMKHRDVAEQDTKELASILEAILFEDSRTSDQESISNRLRARVKLESFAKLQDTTS